MPRRVILRSKCCNSGRILSMDPVEGRRGSCKRAGGVAMPMNRSQIRAAVICGAIFVCAGAPASLSAQECGELLGTLSGAQADPQTVQSAKEQCPDDDALHYAIGTYYARQQSFDVAAAEFSQALERAPDPRYLAARGRMRMELGDADGAREDLKLSLEESPEAVAPLEELGVLLVRQGRSDEALPYLEKAAGLDANNARIRLNLGNALMKSGRDADAIPHLERALELEPDLIAAHRNLALAQARNGNFEGAEAHLRKVVEAEPTSVGVYKELAGVLEKREKFADQVQILERAVALDPKNSALRIDYALAMQKAKDFKQSESVLSELVYREPKNVRALVALGWANVQLNRFKEAESSLIAAATEDPSNALAQNNLGVLYLRMKDSQRAHDAFTKALKINPDLASAKENLDLLDHPKSAAKK